ncbi:MAG: hypothetical protein ACKVP2_03410 [Burkholderiales bacterium]
MISLNSADANQVASARSFRTSLGRKSLITFSGIAIFTFDTDDNELKRTTVQIDLNALSEQPLSASSPDCVVSVGLAGISNTESEFVFATDNAWLETDFNGRMFLYCDIAVSGDVSNLFRFSYFATAIVEVDEPFISGTIFWNTALLSFASMDSPLFEIHVEKKLPILQPPAPSSGVPTFGGPVETWERVLSDLVYGTPRIAATNEMELDYVVRGKFPFDTDLRVAIALTNNGPPHVGSEFGRWSTTPPSIRISASNYKINGVDIRADRAPR